MTPKEFQAAAADLAKEIGVRTEIFLNLSSKGAASEPCMFASVYPTGLCDGMAFSVQADDIDDLLKRLQAKWAEHKDRYRGQVIRKMALAIIRITAEQGECTDAALRAEFNPGDVAMFGVLACADADRIANNGPFSIKAVQGANAA